MSSEDDDAARLAELAAIVQSVREHVRSRYPQPGSTHADTLSHPVQAQPTDLLPVLHARDAAQAKVAAIGSVNPRAGGFLNKLIQAVKHLIARSLRWFVRDQVSFNREAVVALEAVLEALNDQNRTVLSLAAQVNEQLRFVRDNATESELSIKSYSDRLAADTAANLEGRLAEVRRHAERQLEVLVGEARELKDVRTHWIEWRAGWEQKLATNEAYFLRSVAELQAAFQYRLNQLESTFRDLAKAQHGDYLAALDRANLDIQKRLWADLEKVRADYEKLIHTELRLIRLRAGASQPPAEALASASSSVPASASPPAFDYSRFAERFRGSEEYVRGNQEFYRPLFSGRTNVLDIGCGRGEFLLLMRDEGVSARGIDLGAESIEQCRSRGLQAEQADLFAFLPQQADGEFDAIMSAQVIEHLDPARLPEMIRLCSAKLSRGGILVLETPNPECLAIFATHFYLDPTHTRPVPHPLVSFYMEESGLGAIELHRLSPAVDSMPEIAELPAGFQKRFFGGLDFAIVGRKL